MEIKKNKNVLIFGPIPPPAGGISVHIARLTCLIKDDFCLDFVDESSVVKNGFYSIKSYNPFLYLKKIIAADILFIHTAGSSLRKFHILVGKFFFKKIILTVHGYSKVNRIPFLLIDSLFFQLSNKIVLVNPYIFDKLYLPKRKCIFKHAFIPPSMSVELDLPDFINNWFDQRRQYNHFILCANASRLNIFEGQDLYGLDMCIVVTKRLLDRGFPVSFIYIVSSLENCEEIYFKYERLIIELNLQDHFLLLNASFSFVKVIEKSDVVLRPTNADGDAVTIREAIYLGKPILASDIVKRPYGTLLFKTRNMDDLFIKLVTLLGDFQSFSDFLPNEMNRVSLDYRLYYSGLINNVINS